MTVYMTGKIEPMPTVMKSLGFNAAKLIRPICLAVIGGLLLTTPVLADNSVKNKGQAVDIEANNMEVRETANQAIFTGVVKARRGTVTLNCERLEVDYASITQSDGSKKTDVTHLRAKGGVVIITPKQHITGQWAKMDVKADTVLVGGNVKVKQGSSQMNGEQLSINLKNNLTRMTGGRVKGSFLPAN